MSTIDDRAGQWTAGRGLGGRQGGPLLLILAFGLLAANPTIAATYHVAPAGNGDVFSAASPGSIEGVIEKIRRTDSAMSEDIVVVLHGGVYRLKATLSLDRRDGGTNGFQVIYQAAPGEHPVISGGRPIEGWVAAGGGVFKAEGVDFEFRQLYVNGRRATRARTPNRGDDGTMGPYRRFLKIDNDTNDDAVNDDAVKAAAGPWPLSSRTAGK